MKTKEIIGFSIFVITAMIFIIQLSTKNPIEQEKPIEQDFVCIDDNLYYAKDTDVVYWIDKNDTNEITVWYSDTGKMMRYDPVLHKMYEINDKTIAHTKTLN